MLVPTARENTALGSFGNGEMVEREKSGRLEKPEKKILYINTYIFAHCVSCALLIYITCVHTGYTLLCLVHIYAMYACSVLYHTWCVYIWQICYMCVHIHTHIHTLCVCSESATKKTSRDHENLCMSAETDYILQFEISLSLDQHLAK